MPCARRDRARIAPVSGWSVIKQFREQQGDAQVNFVGVCSSCFGTGVSVIGAKKARQAGEFS